MPRKTRAATTARKAPSAPPVEPSREAAALAPGEILATQDVIQALIEESAYARIRHRALLDVLTTGFTPQKYRARFVELCRRDLSALVHRAFITPDAFRSRFGAWMSENESYYSAFLLGETIEGDT